MISSALLDYWKEQLVNVLTMGINFGRGCVFNPW